MGKAGLSQRLAAYISEFPEEEISERVRRTGVLGVRDVIGVIAAGAIHETGKVAAAYARKQAGPERCVAVGQDFRTSPLIAALTNGILGHAHDFDDTNLPAYAHLSGTIVPSLLALAEEREIPGRRVLSSYLMGYEIGARLGAAMNADHRHSDAGWHPTGTLGSLASAAACARLLSLDPDRTAATLSIAASSAAGLKANTGTMIKPYHAGRAAMNGVMAACMAEEGLVARADILEHDHGFCLAFHGNIEPDWDAADADLTRLDRIAAPLGLAIKPYPCCGAAHPSIQAALELRNEHNVAPDFIDLIEVGCTKLTLRQMVFHDPQIGAEAKFSIEHCVGTALLEGSVGLRHFTDEFTLDNRVKAMARRVRLSVDPQMADNSVAGSVVKVTMRDGRWWEAKTPIARGKNGDHLPEADLLAKFVGNAEAIMSSREAERLSDLILDLERQATIRPIAEFLFRGR